MAVSGQPMYRFILAIYGLHVKKYFAKCVGVNMPVTFNIFARVRQKYQSPFQISPVTYSKRCQTSKMELFAKIGNG